MVDEGERREESLAALVLKLSANGHSSSVPTNRSGATQTFKRGDIASKGYTIDWHWKAKILHVKLMYGIVSNL